MWVDVMVPVKLTYVSTPVSYTASGTVKVIQSLGGMATVKALTDNGAVYGSSQVYSAASGIPMMPGERWEGNFKQIEITYGMIIVHELPGGNLSF